MRCGAGGELRHRSQRAVAISEQHARITLAPPDNHHIQLAVAIHIGSRGLVRAAHGGVTHRSPERAVAVAEEDMNAVARLPCGDEIKFSITLKIAGCDPFWLAA